MLHLKEHREAAGLSQQTLANLSGLSLRTVAYAEEEAPDRDMKVSTLRALADALGVSVDDLFESPNGKRQKARRAAS